MDNTVLARDFIDWGVGVRHFSTIPLCPSCGQTMTQLESSSVVFCDGDSCCPEHGIQYDIYKWVPVIAKRRV